MYLGSQNQELESNWQMAWSIIHGVYYMAKEGVFSLTSVCFRS